MSNAEGCRERTLVGPIALVKNGDAITIDAEKRQVTRSPIRRIEAAVRKSWMKPALRYTRGVLAKYTAHITSTSLGAVTDIELKL